jgi:hypothetical protein
MTRHDLLEFTAGGVAFYYAQRVYWWAAARYINWKFGRDFRAAEARMRGCQHIETAVIDTGIGLDGNSRKCRACWAICICGEWSPNSAPWSSYDADGYPLYSPHSGGGPRDVSGR